MKSRIPFLTTLTAVLLSVLLISCTANSAPTPSATTTPEKTAVKTDLTELRKYITVPGTPSAVKWQITRLGPQNNDSGVPGPSTYQLIAILNYSDAEIAALKAKFVVKAGDILVGPNAIQDWFPASVQAAFIKQSDNNYKLNGQALSAEPFYRSPYLQGDAALIGNGELWLTLIAD